MAYRPDRAITLLPATILTTAVTAQVSTALTDIVGVNVATFQATFTYGSAGTTTKVWIQTTFDGGASWVDIANFAFTTSSARTIQSVRSQTAVGPNYVATDGTLADNTIKDGLLGSQLRTKLTTTGTYADDTTLTIHAVLHG